MNEANLKNLMLEHSGNLKNFAKAANIPYTTLRSIIERGVMNATVSNIIKISDTLELTTQLLTPKNQTFDDPISQIYRQLTNNRQQKVLAYAKSELQKQQQLLPFTRSDKGNYLIQLSGSVSAGSGEYLLDEYVEDVTVNTKPPKHDFAVRVNGDSMAPVLLNDEIIYVKKAEEARLGQIIVASVNGEAFVKKLARNKLLSLNPHYPDILINPEDDVKLLGIVIL